MTIALMIQLRNSITACGNSQFVYMKFVHCVLKNYSSSTTFLYGVSNLLAIQISGFQTICGGGSTYSLKKKVSEQILQGV